MMSPGRFGCQCPLSCSNLTDHESPWESAVVMEKSVVLGDLSGTAPATQGPGSSEHSAVPARSWAGVGAGGGGRAAESSMEIGPKEVYPQTQPREVLARTPPGGNTHAKPFWRKCSGESHPGEVIK